MQQTVIKAGVSFLASSMTCSNQTSGYTGCLFYRKDAGVLKGKQRRQRMIQTAYFNSLSFWHLWQHMSLYVTSCTFVLYGCCFVQNLQAYIEHNVIFNDQKSELQFRHSFFRHSSRSSCLMKQHQVHQQVFHLLFLYIKTWRWQQSFFFFTVSYYLINPKCCVMSCVD